MLSEFKNKLKSIGLDMTVKQEEQLKTYFEMLVEWNQKMNLTAITEQNDVYLKHFYDSLTPTATFDFSKIETMCDVGAGAGFPSVVIKIFFPQIKLTIVEALEKRLSFLKVLIDALNLEHVALVHARAEVYAQTHREYFDVVIARAVARLPMLAELCVPLVKKDGVFIALKGEQGMEEKQEAEQALKLLGISAIDAETLYLSGTTDKRIILICHKEKETNKKYPRHFNKIKAKPL